MLAHGRGRQRLLVVSYTVLSSTGAGLRRANTPMVDPPDSSGATGSGDECTSPLAGVSRADLRPLVRV